MCIYCPLCIISFNVLILTLIAFGLLLWIEYVDIIHMCTQNEDQNYWMNTSKRTPRGRQQIFHAKIRQWTRYLYIPAQFYRRTLNALRLDILPGPQWLDANRTITFESMKCRLFNWSISSGTIYLLASRPYLL